MVKQVFVSLIFGLVVLSASLSAAAETIQPDLVIVPPRDATAGETVRFTAVLTNSQTQPVLVPETLVITLAAPSGKTVSVPAHSEWQSDSAATIVPGKGFLKQEYAFLLPVDMAGLVTLSVSNGDPVMFSAALSKQKIAVADTGDRDTEAKAGGSTPPPPPESKKKNASRQFQPFFLNFSSYKPVYFLFGMDPGVQNSSFQISFQYKMFNFEPESFGKKYLSSLENIRLAYTQQSFWNLKSDSSPFEDSRYMPELFYEYTKPEPGLGWLEAWGFRTGLQHESNGRGGSLSRSTNYGYIQPFLEISVTDRLYWKFAPKAWVYVWNEHENNGDLADYRGYFDIENKIGDPEGFVLENHFRHGRKGGTCQFDLSYPLNRIPWLRGFVDMYIHARYVTGYSDQLLRYNRREDIIRLGFSLVR